MFERLPALAVGCTNYMVRRGRGERAMVVGTAAALNAWTGLSKRCRMVPNNEGLRYVMRVFISL